MPMQGAAFGLQAGRLMLAAFGAAAAAVTGSLGAEIVGEVGREVDYIEIGTQTFDTLSDSRPDKIGLSVDMVREYLSMLKYRSQSKVGKLYTSAAIVPSPSSAVVIHKVKERFVEECKGPCPLKCNATTWRRCGGCKGSYQKEIREELERAGLRVLTKTRCLPWWSLGMNSLNSSWHDWLPVTPLSKVDYLLERRRVKSQTPEQLLLQFNIVAAEHLKVDAEGYDGRIVAAFADLMRRRKRFRPKQISWECKGLGMPEIVGVVRKLQRLGYLCDVFDYHKGTDRKKPWFDHCGCALPRRLLTWPMHVD
eukprot:TRINITY_DN52476_c0_g1_i1.p1 TRINITY_DN52476_c0_g1~~TRINITY_DN52476_c0_g1_i1.p1  ORF type:complete len:308 (-),score=71.70 TRINITY_DN52476_c0_g1_i1:638-1561(-)